MTGCPCGGAAYDECCGPLHRGQREAATPEELMRARYSAYALGEENYVFRTWHPRTRPDVVSTAVAWKGLVVLNAHDDMVEFVARRAGGQLHEVSRFERRRGRWVYVEGDVT